MHSGVMANDNPFTSANRANIWIDNGVSSRTYSIPSWSKMANFSGGEISVDGGNITNTVLSRVGILVNNTATSYPKIGALLPDLSLVGLDSATNKLGDLLDKATLSLSPNGGSFDDTIEVKLELVSKLEDAKQVTYKIDGVLEPTKTLIVNDANNSVSIFLSKNGKHTIEYKFQNEAYYNRAEFEIYNKDNKRDSDGDGIPDVVEAELGTNPFEFDSQNGWSAFDNYMRGSKKIDSDGDGWSDFDEEVLRGTNPDNNLSKPTATSLYGVEYKLSSSAQKSDGNISSISRISFVDMKSTVLYDTKKSYKNSAILAPLTDANITAILANGNIPTVRMSASVPIVERVRENNTSNSWVSKKYIPSNDNLDVKNFYAVFAQDENITDVNLTIFKDAYVSYLESNLVVSKSAVVDDNSSLEVGLVELALRTRVDGNSTVVLGDPDFALAINIYGATMNALRDTNRTMNKLVSDMDLMLQKYPLDLSDMNQSMQDDGNSTERRMANYMQNVLSESDRYKVSLMTILDFATADVQAQNSIDFSVFSSNVDSDADGLSNKEEVLVIAYTNPLEGDSDGDMLSDKDDPCPNDATNSCLNDGLSSSDIDGDGIVDGIDNCPFDANSNQEDSNNDGIGDICAKRGIVIISPRTNISLSLNDSVTFVAKKTVQNSNSVSWSIDGNDMLGEHKLSFNYLFYELGEKNICARLDEQRKSCIKVTVLNSYEQKSFKVYAAEILEGNSGEKNALVEVVLDTPAKVSRELNYQTSDLLATAGEDYNATKGSLIFNVNEQRKYFTVPIQGDTKYENNENIKVFVSENDFNASATLFILNDDAAPDNNETNTTTSSLYIFGGGADDTYGYEPWVTDGTSNNTHILKDLVEGNNSSYPCNFIKVAALTYFTASDKDGNATLFQSDGTTEGTQELYDFGNGGYPYAFTDINDTLYFLVMDGNITLYKAGNGSIHSLAQLVNGYGAGAEGGNGLIAVGDNLYFMSNLYSGDEYQFELHKYSFTDNKVSLVEDLNQNGGSYIPDMVPVGHMLYFMYEDDNNKNQAIYKTDGTAKGTQVVVSNLSSVFHDAMLNIGEHLYYFTRDYDYNTSTSKVTLVDYNVNSDSSSTVFSKDDNTSINKLYDVGGALYYITALYDSSAKTTNYKVRSTTDIVQDVQSNQFNMLVYGNRYYYVIDDGLYNNSGDTLLSKTNDGWIEFSREPLGDREVFGYDDVNGNQVIYTTDGTVNGTNELVHFYYTK